MAKKEKKPAIEFDQEKGELTIDKNTNDGLAKILMAKKEVTFFGQKVKVKSK